MNKKVRYGKNHSEEKDEGGSKMQKKRCVNKTGRMKDFKEAGITLIALVVTLVVLLILAAISINFLVGDNGIFKTANDAKIQHRIGEILDELNVAESSVSLEKLGKPSLEEYIKYIQDNNIVTEAEKQEDGSYLITTEDGYMFQISIVEGENVNDIVIGYVGTANGPRIKAIHVTGKTTNSISVEVETANSEGATYKYEYRKDGEDDNSWKLAEESKNATCTITGLAGNQIYDIRVTVTTSEGSASKITSDKTGELEAGTIEFEEYVWQGDGTASIVIRNNSLDTSYHLEYRIGLDGQWTEIASGQEITGLMHSQTVYGRLYDGINEASPASVEIKDETNPNAPSITPSGTSGNNNYYKSDVTVSITAGSDNESGADKIRYSVSGAQTIGETTTASGTTTANITITTDGPSTITAYTIDKAGNVSAAKTQVINKDNTAPSTASLTVTSYDEDSISVRASGADATSGIYSYAFQRSTTSATTGFTTVDTKTSTASSYDYPYTGLADETTYYLRVVVTDRAGNATTGTAVRRATAKKLATNVNELEAGDYVYYYDKNNTRRECVVLYDASSGYGVQIITMETLEEINLGNGRGSGQGSGSTDAIDFERAIDSYNSAITTLNTRAEAYRNTTYSSSARSVGSVPNNKNAESGYYTITIFNSSYNEKIKGGDNNYKMDEEQMEKLGIQYTTNQKSYWLASRELNEIAHLDTINFDVRDFYVGDIWYSWYMGYIDLGDEIESLSFNRGLRPVFTLKPEIKITGGTGEKNNPYTLGT